jgi:DNA-binding response OmpR family regulator
MAMNDKKVLIIDDEEDFGFLMTDFFSKKGYQVFVASDIATGLEILENENPELLFLDNNLPDGFGWGETEHILLNYPNTKLNLISAMEVPMTTASSFRILYKPFIKDELNKIFV